MKILLSIFCLLILVSCSQEPEVSRDQINYRDGVPYLVNTQEPFTGVVVIKRTWGNYRTEKHKYKKGELLEIREFNSRGQIRKLESYKNGKLHGPEEWYSDTGVLDMMNLHENGVEIGEKYFDDEGNLHTERSKLPNENLIFTYYHENGQVYWTGEKTKDGKMTGTHKRFDKKGNDISNSSWTEYGLNIYGDNIHGDDGSYCKRKFKNGLEEGLQECFYPSGNLRFGIEYSKGELNGSKKHYYDNGKPSYLYTYQNGKQHGPYKKYDKEGNLIGNEEWKDGELVE